MPSFRSSCTASSFVLVWHHALIAHPRHAQARAMSIQCPGTLPCLSSLLGLLWLYSQFNMNTPLLRLFWLTQHSGGSTKCSGRLLLSLCAGGISLGLVHSA